MESLKRHAWEAESNYFPVKCPLAGIAMETTPIDFDNSRETYRPVHQRLMDVSKGIDHYDTSRLTGSVKTS